MKIINYVKYLTAFIDTNNTTAKEPGSPKLLVLTNTSIKSSNGVEISEELLSEQGGNFITFYPSPFKTDLLIQYELSEESLTSVEIYSLDGLFSKTIVSNESQASGKQL